MIRSTNRRGSEMSCITHLPIWSGLSDVGIGIRVVGAWWWGCGGRASPTFSSIFLLSSRFGGHVGHSFDQVSKNLKLDLASPRNRRKVCGFVLLGCRRSGFHGCATRVTMTRKAHRRQSKGKLRWNLDHRERRFYRNLEREWRSRSRNILTRVTREK